MIVILVSNTAQHLKTGLMRNSNASTEKYADINADDSLAPEATARIPFSGTGIRIYGLKTSALVRHL